MHLVLGKAIGIFNTDRVVFINFILEPLIVLADSRREFRAVTMDCSTSANAKVIGKRTNAFGVILSSISLDEQLWNDYAGGLAFENQINEQWPFKFDGRLATYRARSTYKADAVQVSGGVVTNASRRLTLTEDAEGDRLWATGIDLGIQVERKMAEAITLGGFVNLHYLSYAPQMRYGSTLANDPNADLISINENHILGIGFGVRFKAVL